MLNYNECKFKKDRILVLKHKLKTDARWASRGVQVLYNSQTEDEQHSGITAHDNGIGFSGADSEILTSFAKQMIDGRTLSRKQMGCVFKLVPKYARQLDDVAQLKKQEQQSQMVLKMVGQ